MTSRPRSGPPASVTAASESLHSDSSEPELDDPRASESTRMSSKSSAVRSSEAPAVCVLSTTQVMTHRELLKDSSLLYLSPSVSLSNSKLRADPRTAKAARRIHHNGPIPVC